MLMATLDILKYPIMDGFVFFQDQVSQPADENGI